MSGATAARGGDGRDGLEAATARLEAAVDRLARAAVAAAHRPAAPRDPAAEAEIADLGRRLDETIARLKLALDGAGEDGADAGSAATRRPTPSPRGEE